MACLVFPTLDALQAVLRAGVIPPEVQRAPVRFARQASGAIELEPSLPVAPGKKAQLKDYGVLEQSPGPSLREASCWAAALPMQRLGEPDAVPAVALFVLPRRDGVAALCGELLRLGCDRQRLRVLPDGRALVWVDGPPFFVLARAFEGSSLRVFVPTPPRQQAVWTELAWAHPLQGFIEAPASGLLLIGGDGAFEPLPDAEWTALDALVVPAGLAAAAPLTASPLPRIEVSLRLATSARRDEPSLWVLPDGLAQVEALVRHSPESALDGILFAVCDRLVVLKARPGREKAIGALPGLAHARVNELPNLFAPLGTAIEPPLSRERVREWLAPDTEQVTWLVAGAPLGRQSLPEAAFRPLVEWVDYVIDTHAAPLQAWVKSATFDFDSWAGAELVPAPEGRAAADEPDQGAGPRRAPRARPPRRERKVSRELPQAQPSMPGAVATAEPSALEHELTREEAAFLELEGQADSPERRVSWQKLARLNSALGRGREAGLSWAHAVWEVEGPEAAALARDWAESTGATLQTLLQVATPSPEQTRSVVAHLLALAGVGEPRSRSRVPEAQLWLDKHDENLDVRSLWLGRYALARLAGADALGLARARDRVLSRLRRGLSLERDVPRFLRAVGPGTQRDAARVELVTQQLEAVLTAFDETPRKRSPLEGPWPLTRAYVGLEFAWGFARLGDLARARALEEAALRAVDVKDPVHAVLTGAYLARIAQATEGLPLDAPMPREHGAALNALEPLTRYRVDRLRAASSVLEPQEIFDPTKDIMRAWSVRGGEGLAALRELVDPTELVAALEARALVAADLQLPPDERARLLDGLLDFLLRLPESAALPLLHRFVGLSEGLAANHRIVVLEGALKIAGHFGRGLLVRQLVMTLSGLLSELEAMNVAEVGAALAAGVRSMRRVGLRDEAAALLKRAAGVLKGERPAMLTARLSVASGFAYLGRLEQAAEILDEVLVKLPDEKEWSTPERLKLAKAAARALANAPTDFALSRLLRLTSILPSLTDGYNTNDFFCLSVVDFADTMVVGHVGEDLTLSELTRSFLEEDEYLVRRRVHRDAGQG